MQDELVLMEPIHLKDKFGAEKTVWNECCYAHAERVTYRGHRSEEVAEHFPDVRTEWNIRSYHCIDENWRVRHVGGYLYTVVAITPNRRRGYNKIICERVNE